MSRIYQLDEIEIDAGDWCLLDDNFWQHLVRKCINFDEDVEAYFCSRQVIREQDENGPEIIAKEFWCYWCNNCSWNFSKKITVDENAGWEKLRDGDTLSFSEICPMDLFSYRVKIKQFSQDLNYEIQASVYFDGLADLRKVTIVALRGVDKEAANTIESWFIMDVVGS